MQTRTIVDLLEGTLKDYEERDEKYRGYYGVRWLPEFQTVKLSLGRQLGHTTAALKLMSKYNVVIVAHDNHYRNSIIHDLDAHKIVKVEQLKESIFTLGYPYQGHTKFNNLDFIIFDSMTCFDKNAVQREKRQEFMHIMSSRTKLFVELG